MPIYKKIDMHPAVVKESLSYDAETGKLTWLIDAARNVKAGSEAGCFKGVRLNKKTGQQQRYMYVKLAGYDIPAARVAWVIQHGYWPEGNVLFKDGDSSNLRLSNLTEARFTMKSTDLSGRKRHVITKEAQRHYGLKRYYGLTGEQYGQMLADQKGLCAVCDKPETAVFNGQPKVMHVDHCHATGKIRALLCGKCNGMLGLACDNPTTLRAAADYIEKHAATETNVVAFKKEGTE